MEREKPLETDTIKLNVPDNVKSTLEERSIRIDDVMKVIINAENTGGKIVNAKNSHLISHMVIGGITCWAEYTSDENGYTLYNAYFHRIRIGDD